MSELKQTLVECHSPPFVGKNTSFWLRSSEELQSLRRSIDETLVGFSYYPESEWQVWGHRPAEGLPFYGAWRSDDLTQFVHLVGEAFELPESLVNKVLLMLSASGSERLERLVSDFDSLTKHFRKNDEATIAQQQLLARQTRFAQSYASGHVTAMFGVATVFLNIVSHTIDSEQVPQTGFRFMAELYDFSTMSVHITARLSLFIMGLFCITFFLRHFVFMVKS